MTATPLDEMYAEPARDLHRERAAARSASTRWRGSPSAAGGSRAVTVRGEALPLPRRGRRGRAVVRPARRCSRTPTGVLAPLLAAAAGTAASPIVTVNLWLDRQVLPDAFVGLPGRTMQWVFDTGQIRSTRGTAGTAGPSGRRRPPLARVERRGGGPAPVERRADRACAGASCATAVPEARAATLRRATVVREPQASFSLAPGQPARPGTRTAVAGAVSGRRLGGYRTSRDHRERRRQRPPGGGRYTVRTGSGRRLRPWAIDRRIRGFDDI